MNSSPREVAPVRRPNVVAIAVGASALFTVLLGGSPYLPPAFGWAAVLMGVATLILVVANPRLVLRAPDLAALVFAVVALVTTLANGMRSSGPLLATLAALGVFLGVRHLGRRRPELLRHVAILVAGLVLTLTALSLAWPRYDAMGTPQYFTGGKNSVSIVLLWVLLVLTSWWRPSGTSGRIVRTAAVAVALLTMFYCGSSTAKALTLLIVPMLALPAGAYTRWRAWLVALLVLHVAVLTGWLLVTAAWVREIVIGELGKDASFTGRSYIWDRTWEAIVQQPLGYGRGNSYVASYVSSQVSEAHNLFLEAGLAGGILLMLAIATLVAASTREAAQCDDARAVMWIALAVTLGIVESVTFTLDFWFLLAVSTVAMHHRGEVSGGAEHPDSHLQSIA
jgi:O-antigen ligase